MESVLYTKYAHMTIEAPWTWEILF